MRSAAGGDKTGGGTEEKCNTGEFHSVLTIQSVRNHDLIARLNSNR
jgi:hypothetical protein